MSIPLSDVLILEEELDPNYEPTSSEINEYALYLGIDHIKDSDYLYIAREGLKAPLPSPWKPCQTKDGSIFYFNTETKVSSWDHPCDDYYRQFFMKAKKSGGNQKLEPIPHFGLESHGRKEDLLKKLDKEKKANQYRKSKEEELESDIYKIDRDFDEELRILKKENDEKIKELTSNLERNLQNYSKQLQNITDSSAPFKQELDLYESELRSELEKINKKNLEKEQKLLDQDFQTFETHLLSTVNTSLQNEEDTLNSQKDSLFTELSILVQKLDKLRANGQNEPSLTHLKLDLEEEYEEKMKKEKEKLKRKFELEIEEKEKELIEQHEARILEIESLKKKENLKKAVLSELEYKELLDQEFDEKINDFKSELNKKLELEKLLVMERIKEYERGRREEINKKIQEVRRGRREEWEERKQKMEEELILKKKKVENEKEQNIRREEEYEEERIKEKRAQNDLLKTQIIGTKRELKGNRYSPEKESDNTKNEIKNNLEKVKQKKKNIIEQINRLEKDLNKLNEVKDFEK